MSDKNSVPLLRDLTGVVTLPVQAIDWRRFVGSQPEGNHLFALDRIYTDYISDAMQMEMASAEKPVDPAKWRTIQRTARSAAEALSATDTTFGGMLSDRITSLLAADGENVDVEKLILILKHISELEQPKGRQNKHTAIRRDMIAELHHWWIEGVDAPMDTSSAESPFIRLVRFIAKDDPPVATIKRDIEKMPAGQFF